MTGGREGPSCLDLCCWSPPRCVQPEPLARGGCLWLVGSECSSATSVQSYHRLPERRYYCRVDGLAFSWDSRRGLYAHSPGLSRRDLIPPFSDGVARVGATLSGELLNAVFANIGQRAVRKVARETFEHLLSLDLKFHLSRQTGGLTRAIDRGTKGISFLIQAILFRIAPTALEISLVCGILVGAQSFI